MYRTHVDCHRRIFKGRLLQYYYKENSEIAIDRGDTHWYQKLRTGKVESECIGTRQAKKTLYDSKYPEMSCEVKSPYDTINCSISNSKAVNDDQETLTSQKCGLN